MTRLIPKVMLFMMVVSLLFIATAAANMALPEGWPDYEPGMVRPEPEFSNRYDYYDYVIERIQSHSQYTRLVNPNDSRVAQSRVAQIISGNFPGLADGYTSDRLQDLINDFRTRV
ncbi:MAG: hypothetical protein GKC07_05425 [Methanomicrobiales archaeon]|nr:hypothetical protein [Methanomicrobiales archaeon]